MTWKLECQTCKNAKFYGVIFACDKQDCRYEPYRTVATTSVEQLVKLQQTVSNKTEVERNDSTEN